MDNDAISKKALLEWLRERKKALRSDLSYAKKEDTGWSEFLRHQIKMHSEFIEPIEYGRFDIPSPADGRYREREAKTIESIKGALSALGMRDSIDDVRDILQTVLDSLSPIGEQKDDTGPSKSTLGLMTMNEYEMCPECRGSFSFRKPASGKCPWCGNNLAGLEDTPDAK